jgi:hypothetical protein
VGHPCHQCGTEVGEGSPFCRQCGAPQIRVSPGNGEEPPANDLLTAKGPGADPTLIQPAKIGINRRIARRQAALAGILVAVFLILSYFLAPIFLFIPLAGLLAVQRYLGEVPRPKLSPGAGAGIGLLTGFLGFLMCDIPYVSIMSWCLAFHRDCAPVRSLRAQIDAAIHANPNPQLQQALQSWLTPTGVFFSVVFISVVTLILTLALSAIGGAIGANLANRRR